MDEPADSACEATETDLVLVTVIICTRNRARQLSCALESAAALQVPEGLCWEFIVVDNGSSDDTASVVSSFAARLPIRRVVEDRAGLSWARNCGVRAARGQYICWTDDDVRIDSQWLAAYVAAFRRHGEAAVFGGRVLPELQGPTPGWFAALHREWPITTMLAQRDFGDDVLPITFSGGRTPYGANFAVRAREQKAHLYNVELGASPDFKRVGEETDVIYRILMAGGEGWWVPDAKVNHLIPSKLQSYRHVYNYAARAGETVAYLLHASPDGGDSYLTVSEPPPETYHLKRWQLYCEMACAAVKIGVWSLTGNHRSKLHNMRWLGFYTGLVSFRKTPRHRAAQQAGRR